MRYFFFTVICFIIYSCSSKESSLSLYQVKKSTSKILIDGIGNEDAWQTTVWRSIDQKWLGEDYSPEDFSGKYKILWSKDYLYILAEIIDDHLVDTHPDGLVKYWDDDCLEVFIDEDNSKGIHQYNHNAFAYHIALDGKVADIGPDSIPHYYQHIVNNRLTKGNLSTWELAISIYDDSYQDDGVNSLKPLMKDKKMGFAIAYCDNDKSEERENFIGSTFVLGKDKNRGWIDAGVFEEIILSE